MAELIEANQYYAQVAYPDGRNDTVATKDLAPYPREAEIFEVTTPTPENEDYSVIVPSELISKDINKTAEQNDYDKETNNDSSDQEALLPRRSIRTRKNPDRLDL